MAVEAQLSTSEADNCPTAAEEGQPWMSAANNYPANHNRPDTDANAPQGLHQHPPQGVLLPIESSNVLRQQQRPMTRRGQERLTPQPFHHLPN